MVYALCVAFCARCRECRARASCETAAMDPGTAVWVGVGAWAWACAAWAAWALAVAVAVDVAVAVAVAGWAWVGKPVAAA